MSEWPCQASVEFNASLSINLTRPAGQVHSHSQAGLRTAGRQGATGVGLSESGCHLASPCGFCVCPHLHGTTLSLIPAGVCEYFIGSPPWQSSKHCWLASWGSKVLGWNKLGSPDCISCMQYILHDALLTMALMKLAWP